MNGADVPGAGQVGERGQPLDGERAGEGEAGGPAEGPQHVEVADGGDGEGGVADPGGDPVRPGGQEAREVAERLARVDVRAAGARVAAREAAEDQGQGDRADRQHGEGEQADRPVGRHGGGDHEDAAADDVAHHQRGRGRQAEAAAGRRRGRGGRRGRRVDVRPRGSGCLPGRGRAGLHGGVGPFLSCALGGADAHAGAGGTLYQIGGICSPDGPARRKTSGREAPGRSLVRRRRGGRDQPAASGRRCTGRSARRLTPSLR